MFSVVVKFVLTTRNSIFQFLNAMAFSYVLYTFKSTVSLFFTAVGLC